MFKLLTLSLVISASGLPTASAPAETNHLTSRAVRGSDTSPQIQGKPTGPGHTRHAGAAADIPSTNALQLPTQHVEAVDGEAIDALQATWAHKFQAASNAWLVGDEAAHRQYLAATIAAARQYRGSTGDRSLLLLSLDLGGKTAIAAKDADLAKQYLQEALGLVDAEMPAAAYWLASLQANLAASEFIAGRSAVAVQLAERALPTLREFPLSDELVVTLAQLAQAQIQQDQHGAALSTLSELLTIHQARGAEDAPAVERVLRLISECALMSEQAAVARESAARRQTLDLAATPNAIQLQQQQALATVAQIRGQNSTFLPVAQPISAAFWEPSLQPNQPQAWSVWSGGSDLPHELRRARAMRDLVRTNFDYLQESSPLLMATLLPEASPAHLGPSVLTSYIQELTAVSGLSDQLAQNHSSAWER